MVKFGQPAGAGRVSSRPASASDRPRFFMNYREADCEVYARLHADGFQGPEQEKLEARVTEYALQLLMLWTLTGEIYNRVKAVNRPVAVDAVAMQRLHADPEARRDLVQDTVLAALPLFRSQLKSGAWDPEKGTLTTYFIGTVVLSFSNVYRAWVRKNAADARVEPMGVTPEELSPVDVPRTEDDVARSVEQNETVENFFRMLKSPDREVARMAYEGKTTTEIAEHFEVTPVAIRRRLRRLADKATAAGLV
ncbi:sigma-70 family RNA polymerase sigma factor [Streptomyces sp. WAC 00631]|uniref:sigma-70 family RNA polymerase sigma factor n=1 Tax=Streptomyces sp. WAC 00631 TaxID=2203201 RepID=UPI000F77010D|nr:sigma-70 family RNA polymerase sigma factor [Streptomyces sp. WAC 00631]MCC5032445.1 sigma-70 family RNA polymerase sigma factor [Streptomyces sp. WAC 00631]